MLEALPIPTKSFSFTHIFLKRSFNVKMMLSGMIHKIEKLEQELSPFQKEDSKTAKTKRIVNKECCNKELPETLNSRLHSIKM